MLSLLRRVIDRALRRSVVAPYDTRTGNAPDVILIYLPSISPPVGLQFVSSSLAKAKGDGFTAKARDHIHYGDQLKQQSDRFSIYNNAAKNSADSPLVDVLWLNYHDHMSELWENRYPIIRTVSLIAALMVFTISSLLAQLRVCCLCKWDMILQMWLATVITLGLVIGYLLILIAGVATESIDYANGNEDFPGGTSKLCSGRLQH